MARNPRCDEPGSWHHVMNRGIARRTVFERREDVRFFLSRLARAVRRGQIEVHAYSLLTTHFHLLVRSPRRQLAEAMRRIQNEFVRWFNRRRKRDGALFRGRFRSKPVTSHVYRHNLVRYIDANPVAAGLVSDSRLYPHGSARAYAGLAGPAWLERSWIEREVRAASKNEAYDPAGYLRAFGGKVSPDLSEWIERRISGTWVGPDPLDDLVGAAPSAVLDWMRRKAETADGTRPGLPVCGVASVDSAVELGRAESGNWHITPGRKRLDAWTQLRAALLRDLAGLSSPQISIRLACAESSVSRMRARHRALMHDAEYASRVQGIASDALRRSGVFERGAIGRLLS